jgi:hypothetical protein
VKLGTITKEGKADVYSYKEDDMVIDPYLAKHLAHFGINIGNMEKVRFQLFFIVKNSIYRCENISDSSIPPFGNNILNTSH